MDQHEFEMLNKKLGICQKNIIIALNEADKKVFRLDTNGLPKEPENTNILKKYQKALSSCEKDIEVLREKAKTASISFGDALAEHSKIEYFIESLIENADKNDLKKIKTDKIHRSNIVFHHPIISAIIVLTIFTLSASGFLFSMYTNVPKDTENKMDAVFGELQEIRSRTEVGISSRAYSDKVSDLKVKFDAFTLSKRAIEHPAYESLEKAVKIHMEGASFWTCSIIKSEPSSNTLGTVIDDAVKKSECNYERLSIEYDFLDVEKSPYYFYKMGYINILWNAANEELEKAMAKKTEEQQNIFAKIFNL